MLIHEKKNINIFSKKTFYPTLLFWLKERLQTDNSINITYPTINDFSKIDYNEYIKLIVPFDNDTIYYENNVWKTKQGGDIPSDVIKDSDLNKDYIDKENDKYIVKTSQDINTKQDKLVIGTNIKTINGNSLLGNGDISISSESKWEVVDTSDFIPSIPHYFIKGFDKTKYQYKLWLIYKYQQNDTLTTPIKTPLNYNGSVEWTRYIPTQDDNLIVSIHPESGKIFFVNFPKGLIQNIILYKKLGI